MTVKPGWARKRRHKILLGIFVLLGLLAGAGYAFDLLRRTFPSWSFASVWTAVASGPDQRRLVAIRGEQVLSAWTADDLAAKVTAESIAEALREEEQP